jgi:predicted phosphodiesterase
MRVALISDIHANEVALCAVLDDIAKLGVDQIVCLGDVATLGPRPSAVIGILRELNCHCILGNHDAFLIEPELIHSYTEAPVVVQSVDWCRAQLSRDELEFFRGFVPHLKIPLDPEARLLVFHGSPRSHMEDLLATTPESKLDQALAGHTATVMAGGHTHIQMLRQHRGVLLVNPGSVGMPFKEYVNGREPTLLPHSEYAVVHCKNGAISVELRRVPLDKAAMRAAIAATDNPLRASLLNQYS